MTVAGCGWWWMDGARNIKQQINNQRTPTTLYYSTIIYQIPEQNSVSRWGRGVELCSSLAIK